MDIVLVAGAISKLEIQITNPIQQICNKYRMHHMYKKFVFETNATF